jgi:hypothetical protein
MIALKAIAAIASLLFLCFLMGTAYRRFSATHPDRFGAASRADLDVDLLIECIRDVEGWRGRPGPNGEGGILQWTEAAWQEDSEKPFLWANLMTGESMREQYRAAHRRINRLRGLFSAHNLTESPSGLALACMAGFEAYRTQRYSTAKFDASIRVLNLYRERKETI